MGWHDHRGHVPADTNNNNIVSMAMTQLQSLLDPDQVYTVRTYSDGGEYCYLIQTKAEILQHLSDYQLAKNTSWTPGTALFIEECCILQGSLTDEQASDITTDLIKNFGELFPAQQEA